MKEKEFQDLVEYTSKLLGTNPIKNKDFMFLCLFQLFMNNSFSNLPESYIRNDVYLTDKEFKSLIDEFLEKRIIKEIRSPLTEDIMYKVFTESDG